MLCLAIASITCSFVRSGQGMSGHSSGREALHRAVSQRPQSLPLFAFMSGPSYTLHRNGYSDYSVWGCANQDKRRAYAVISISGDAAKLWME